MVLAKIRDFRCQNPGFLKFFHQFFHFERKNIKKFNTLREESKSENSGIFLLYSGSPGLGFDSGINPGQIRDMDSLSLVNEKYNVGKRSEIENQQKGTFKCQSLLDTLLELPTS